jgi:hypothetical protein
MRRVLLAAALVIAGSCGGSPTAPALNTEVPPLRPLVLPSGSYTLAITLSTTGLPVCHNGICSSTSLCFNNPASMTASFNVELQRAGDTATVRISGAASTLVLNLQLAQTSVTGAIAGAAPDANGVAIEVSGTITGARPLNTTTAVAGNIDGQLSVPGGGCSNNGHAWSLTPR